MSVTDGLLENDTAYAASFGGELPLPPAMHLAVVACMHARLDVDRILGLHEGEAPVIRNAGGTITDDGIRSLAISQRLLGTTEIVLIHHTDCGMLTSTDEQFGRQLADDTGSAPSGPPGRSTTWTRTCGSRSARVAASPFVPEEEPVRGFVFDVSTATLREVQPA